MKAGSLLLLATLTAIAAVAAAIAVAALAPSGAGPAWQDPSEKGHSSLVEALTQRAPVRVLESSPGLVPRAAGAGDVLFLFPTYRPASQAEMDAVAAFAERGGRVVIAADGDHAAPWAARFGVRFQGLPALLPPGGNVTCVPLQIELGSGPLDACLPSPTAFPQLPAPIRDQALTFRAVGNATTPVFLDLDADGGLSVGDVGPATFPLAFSWAYGAGEVVAVADGDLWRNAWAREQPQNLRFAQHLSRTGTVYLDASAADRDGARWMVGSLHRAIKAPDAVQMTAMGLLAAALAFALWRAPRAAAWKPHRPRDDEPDPDVERAAAQLLQSAAQARPSPGPSDSSKPR